MKFVHVAGTNGKGSTVAFTSSVLEEAGYRVGIYISPYIQRFTERIRINENEIDESELARLTGYVKEKVQIMLDRGESHPTEFEIITAMAFQYFYEKKCDIVVLEVGLGGRFDATNIIDTPLVSVIATINYDHTKILGNTLPEIAFEKAGIIKENGDVVIYPQAREVDDVFRKACEQRGSRLKKADFEKITLLKFGEDGQVFDYKDHKGLEISLLGEHQLKNAALSIEALELLKGKGYRIDEDSLRRGMKNARWPGRMEILRKQPILMIDGAHNTEAAQVLSNTLKAYFPEKRKNFILGVMKDKDYKSMVEAVAPIADRFIIVTPNNERALPAEELAIFVRSYCKNVLVSDTIEDAIRTSLRNSSKDDVICAFGSLYYIGEVRSCLVKT